MKSQLHLVDQTENIQCNFTKHLPLISSLPNSQRLALLGPNFLELCRIRLDLACSYKMFNNLTPSGTRGSMAIAIPVPNIDGRCHINNVSKILNTLAIWPAVKGLFIKLLVWCKSQVCMWPANLICFCWASVENMHFTLHLHFGPFVCRLAAL